MKRPCIRTLADGGKPMEATAVEEKGASTFLAYLYGVKPKDLTRIKTDVHLGRELPFLYV